MRRCLRVALSDPETTALVLRISLVLNFLFTSLSFKIGLSYGYFRKLVYLASLANKHILTGWTCVGIAVFPHSEASRGRQVPLPVLALLSLVVSCSIIFRPSLSWSALIAPTWIMGKGVTIWNDVASLWLIPVYAVVSFLLLLFGFFLTVFVWLYPLAAVVKTISLLSEIAYTRMNKKTFEVIVFCLFVASWALTFWVAWV